MIILCPFCGNKLRNKLKDGITSCDNCSRVFDSSSFHKILSALWIVRNWYVLDSNTIKRQCELTDEETNIVEKYAIEEDHTFDEYVAIVKQIYRDNRMGRCENPQEADKISEPQIKILQF